MLIRPAGRDVTKWSALRASLCLFGVLLAACAGPDRSASGSSNPESPAVVRGPTASGPGLYRLVSVDFFGYLVVDTKNVRPPGMPSPRDVDFAVRKWARSIGGVDAAVANAFAQPPVKAADDEAAAEAYWQILTRGTTSDPGMLAAMKSQVPSGATPVATGAYVRSDMPPYEHIKIGWIAYVQPGSPAEPLTQTVRLKYAGQETAFDAFVGVSLTVAPTGW